MAKSLTYKQRLTQSQKERDSKALEHTVKEAKLQLQSDTLATEKSLLKKQEEVDNLKAAVPLDFSAIIKAQAELGGIQRGLDALNELGVELGLNK